MPFHALSYGMKNKKYSVLKRLFEQYEDGSIPQPQKKVIDEWFARHQEQEVVELLKNRESEERIYQELCRRIIQPVKPAGIIHKLGRVTWLRAACIVLLAGTVAALIYKRQNTSANTSQQAFRTFQTGNGQVKKIELEDGSTVWLNAASTLRVPTPLKYRTIYLDKGEAFFEVKHDTQRPFTVTTGNLVTRDIGTSFNIKAYHPKTDYRVEVASGQVALERLDTLGKTEIINSSVGKGQAIIYDDANKKVQLIKKDPTLIEGWKINGILYLDRLTLVQIAEELSRRFNIRAVVKHPELDHRKYTINLGTYDLGASLRALTQHTGMSYELTPNSLIINPSANSMK